MTDYIIRRVLYMIPTIFIISIISFLVITAPPGDYLSSKAQMLRQQYGNAAQEQLERLREAYGLDQPMYIQYFKWIKGIVTRGDFGRSFETNQAVSEIIIQRVPYTALLSFLTIIFHYIVGVPIALYSAVRQHGVGDYIATLFAFIGKSTPNFLLALILMYFLSTYFGVSIGGLYSLKYQGAEWSLAKFIDLSWHLIPPVIVIGTAGLAGLVRTLRGTLLDELGKDYLQTARSKGLSEWKVIIKHALRVAILPVISTIGWVLPQVVAGSMITAIVLNLPTMGTAMYSALINQDMYVAGSIILITSILTVIGTLISDILLAKIDPRIRYE